MGNHNDFRHRFPNVHGIYGCVCHSKMSSYYNYKCMSLPDLFPADLSVAFGAQLFIQPGCSGGWRPKYYVSLKELKGIIL